jgi:hypothetical protein
MHIILPFHHFMSSADRLPCLLVMCYHHIQLGAELGSRLQNPVPKMTGTAGIASTGNKIPITQIIWAYF